MPLATAYRLPFSVRYSPPPLFDGRVEVHVRTSGDAGPGAVGEFESLLVGFEHLAWTGALSGSGIPPWASSIGSIERIAASKAHFVWRIDGCLFDDKALAILAQLFLLPRTRAPVTSLEVIRRASDAPLLRLHEDPSEPAPYPDAFSPIRGVPSIDPAASDDVVFQLRLARSISPPEAAAIETSLTTWAAATAMGCYGVAPREPSGCGLMPNEVTFFGDEVEFTLSRFRAHAGALDGLSNAALAFHQRIAPVLELRIE